MKNDDVKLDYLLSELAAPPSRRRVGDNWAKIEKRLTRRNPIMMAINRFRESSILFPSRPALLAASFLFVCFGVSVLMTSFSGNRIRNLFIASGDELSSGSGYIENKMDDISELSERRTIINREFLHEEEEKNLSVSRMAGKKKGGKSWGDIGGNGSGPLLCDADKRQSEMITLDVRERDVEERYRESGKSREGGKEHGLLGREIKELRTKVTSLESAETAPASGGDATALTKMMEKGSITIGGSTENTIVVRSLDRGKLNPLDLPTLNTPDGETMKAADFTETPAEGKSPAASLQKIIKTARLELEVKKYIDASHLIEAAVLQYRGFYADSRKQKHDDGKVSGYLVIRVPQANFEGLYSALKKIGRVTAENAKGEDVTAQYTDIASRIRNSEHLERRLLALLEEKKRHDKMSEILEVEREIARVREEVEKMQGQIRSMDDRISLGTIYLTVKEPGSQKPGGDAVIETSELSEASKAIAEILRQTGGKQILRQETTSEGIAQAVYSLQIPRENFARFLEMLPQAGRIKRRSFQGTDLLKVAEIDAQAPCKVVLNISERRLQNVNGNVSMTTLDLGKSTEILASLLNSSEGQVVSRTENTTDGGAGVANYMLSIPRNRYAAFVDSLKQAGRVENKRINGIDLEPVSGAAANELCSLNILISERKTPLPGAFLDIVVENSEEAGKRLGEIRKRNNAETATVQSIQGKDGSERQEWTLRVKVEGFNKLVDELRELGHVRQKNVTGIGSGAEEMPDPKAMATISLTLNQRSPYAPTAEDTSGSIRSAIRVGWEYLYKSMAMIIFGAIVILPWMALFLVINYAVKRWKNRRENFAVEPEGEEETD